MRPRRPPSAASRPLVATAAIAVALAANGAPAAAAIARDDCLAEAPERREARPPARKRAAPPPGARPVQRIADRAALAPGPPRPLSPATMRKVPIDCPPTPEREVRAHADGSGEPGTRDS